jgi:hypothetical protein
MENGVISSQQQLGSPSAAAASDLEVQRPITGFAAEQQSDEKQHPANPHVPGGGVGDEAGTRSTGYGSMPGLGEKVELA